MMKTSIVATFFLLPIILFPSTNSSPHPNDAQLIDKTCKQTPFYYLCVSSLRSDRRSTTANVVGLGLIMVDNIKARATELSNRIKALAGAGSGSDVAEALQYCNWTYGTAINQSIEEAREALSKGNYKFAEDGANGAADGATSCYKKLGGKVPELSGMNKGLHDVSVIASSIARILLSGSTLR